MENQTDSRKKPPILAINQGDTTRRRMLEYGATKDPPIKSIAALGLHLIEHSLASFGYGKDDEK